MADYHRPHNDAFNALLFRLNSIVGQLAQQYQEDVQAAFSANKNQRCSADSQGMSSRGRKSVTFLDDQQWRELPLSYAPALLLDREATAEVPTSMWEREASAEVPTERSSISIANRVDEVKAPEKPHEICIPIASHSSCIRDSTLSNKSACSSKDSAKIQIHSEDMVCSSSIPEVSMQVSPMQAGFSEAPKPGSNSSLKRHFRMRSPWIEQRDFDNVTLQEVMPEEMWTACLRARVSHHTKLLNDSSKSSFFSESPWWRWLVVSPSSRVRGWWVLACALLLLYDVVMVPIDVCFDLKATAFSNVVDIVAATFWSLDIVFTFFIGVQKKRSVEMNPYKIAKLYLKSWFLFDLFLVIPEWITLAIAHDSFPSGQVSAFRMARWGRLMRLLRMARILRSRRLKPFMRRAIYVLNISKVYLQFVHSVSGSSFALIAFFHFVSCFWYAVGNSSDDGWVSVNGLGSASVGQSYTASLHWSIGRLHGMQTYNEMESLTDNALDAFLIYVSLMLAAYYYGKVAAAAILNANAASLHLWKLSVMFVNKYKISRELDMKMVHFLECSTGGVLEAEADEHKLLEALPKTLQHDLLFEARVPFLSSKPFLKDLLAANSRVIHQMCNEAISQDVHLDGELVFQSGDACHSMLFIMSGVMYYTLDNSIDRNQHRAVISMRESCELGVNSSLGTQKRSSSYDPANSTKNKLKANSSVSELVLWTCWNHIGTLLTHEEATSLSLSALRFSHVVAEHKEAFRYAFKYAKRFLWHMNQAPDDIDDLTTFHEITVKDLDVNMFEGTEYDHFMFLSHYKVEAGTEATLMRELFQDILREDPQHSANNFRSPIFIDSEDLKDLSKLKEHVQNSEALVLLLTPGVLSRPWCLVEIVTAVNHGVNIVPVEIQRPGSKYNYPDEQFYANILDGEFLNKAAVDLLESEGISLSDVEKAIRKVFLKIAVPFSPHKTKGVREAECHDIFSRSSNEELLRQTSTAAWSVAYSSNWCRHVPST